MPSCEDSVILEKLTSSEKLLREVDLSYEEKIKRTAEIENSRASFLREVGLVNQPGTRQPIIINLHEDEQMSERLVYCIQMGLTIIGSSSQEANIVLPGQSKTCHFMTHYFSKFFSKHLSSMIWQNISENVSVTMPEACLL